VATRVKDDSQDAIRYPIPYKIFATRIVVIANTKKAEELQAFIQHLQTQNTFKCRGSTFQLYFSAHPYYSHYFDYFYSWFALSLA